MLSEEKEDKCQPFQEKVNLIQEKVFSIQYSVNMLSPDGGVNNDVKKLLFRY